MMKRTFCGEYSLFDAKKIIKYLGRGADKDKGKHKYYEFEK
jgi:hypothetical protein